MGRLTKKTSIANPSAAKAALVLDNAQELTQSLYKQNLELSIVNRTLSLLRKLYQISLLDLNPASLSQRISETIRVGLNMEAVGIFIYDQQGDSLSPYQFSESTRLNNALLKANVILSKLKITHATENKVFREIIQRKKSNSLDNLDEFLLNAHYSKKKINSVSHNIKATLLYPLVTQHRVIGILILFLNRRFENLNEYEKESIKSITDIISEALDKALLYEKLNTANNQLESANSHLKELDRAKSEFVSIASHQLRTPMTGIMGYLSMMTQGDFGKIAPEHMKILVELLAESQRMIRLINQFLNVSKIEAGKFTYTWKPTQLADIVNHVIKEVEKPAADKGLKLQVKMPKSAVPSIMADADKVEDVILNLLDNAIKYTAKGTVTAILESDKGQVHFSVKDSGIGIKPQDATELFNKFVRGTGIAQIHPDGSGLGLFIAKSIVDAHGGHIWVESQGEGKGSTFQFTLPLKPPADVAVPPPDAAAHVVKPRETVKTLKNE